MYIITVVFSVYKKKLEEFLLLVNKQALDIRLCISAIETNLHPCQTCESSLTGKQPIILKCKKSILSS